MDLTYVKKLVKLLSESEVDEIEIEEDGKLIRVARHARGGAQVHPVSFMGSTPAIPSNSPPFQVSPTTQSAGPAAPGPQVPPPPAYHEIKSPIVGTFYRAPAPDAAPFVQVGSPIQPGTVLCIVEAMKLMNEIEADVTGKIAKILVENGQPVEYDQTLFLAEKS
jgi:acetyl-CoA carboxylase biotin carboxyl carrier protein